MQFVKSIDHTDQRALITQFTLENRCRLRSRPAGRGDEQPSNAVGPHRIKVTRHPDAITPRLSGIQSSMFR